MAKVRLNLGPAPEGASVRLFSVFNTSQNEMFVLARDKKTALFLAGSANHFHHALGLFRKDKNYPRADEVRRLFGNLAAYWPLVEKAMADRVEGTVHFEGGSMAVGYEVIRH